MAEERTVLIKIEVDQSAALTELDQVTKRLLILQKERRDLTKEFNRGDIGINQFSKRLNENKLAADRLRKSQRSLTKDLNTENKSLQAVRNSVAKLTDQRNQQEVASKKGRLEFTRLNKAIKEQSVSIRGAEEAGGDFRRSVGNYAKGISDSIPGFGRATSGIIQLTKASLAFIATPIGAILALIAVALGAVAATFSRTVQGGDELAEIMGIVSGTFEALLDILSALGRVIIDSVVGNFKIASAQISLFALNIEKAVLKTRIAFNNLTGDTEEATRLTAKLAETDAELAVQSKVLTDETDNYNNSLSENTAALLNNITATGSKINQSRLLAIAERNLEKANIANIVVESARLKTISQLRLIARDETKTTKERSLALSNAIVIEELALAAEEKLAERKLQNLITSNRINDSDLDDLKELAEAEANVINIAAKSFNRRRELVQQLNELNRKLAAENLKRVKDREKAIKDEAAREAKAQKEIDDLINKEIKSRQKLEVFRAQQDIKLSQSIDNRMSAERALAMLRRDNSEEAIQSDLFVLQSKEKLNEQETIQLQTLRNTELLIEETFQAQLTRIETDGEQARTDELARLREEQRKQLEATTAAQLRATQQQLQAFSNVSRALDTVLKSTGSKFKGFAITQASIDTFSAINRVLADPSPIPFLVRALNAAAIGITGFANVTKIKNQQFHRGAILEGPSHANGGIPFSVGGVPRFEAEGGEAIINKRSMANPRLRSIASAVNVAGGGIPFQRGGDIPFQSGGLTGATFLRNQEASLNNVDTTINEVLNNLPEQVVRVTEINDTQKAVRVSELDATI